MLLIAGIVSASYHVSPKETAHQANRKTFVTIQLETYEIRKKSAETMFETASLSRKEMQERLRNWKPQTKKKTEGVIDGEEGNAKPVRKTRKTTNKSTGLKATNKKPTKARNTGLRGKKKTEKNPMDDWDDISTGD